MLLLIIHHSPLSFIEIGINAEDQRCTTTPLLPILFLAINLYKIYTPLTLTACTPFSVSITSYSTGSASANSLNPSPTIPEYGKTLVSIRHHSGILPAYTISIIKFCFHAFIPPKIIMFSQYLLHLHHHSHTKIL